MDIARTYVEHLGIERVMAIFDEFRSFEGQYLFLGSQLAFTEDKEVTFKYIEAAARTAQASVDLPPPLASSFPPCSASLPPCPMSCWLASEPAAACPFCRLPRWSV